MFTKHWPKRDLNICSFQEVYFVSLGGADLEDAAKRMLVKVGTNGLWSKYSLKGMGHGEKRKSAFVALSLWKVVRSKC